VTASKTAPPLNRRDATPETVASKLGSFGLTGPVPPSPQPIAASTRSAAVVYSEPVRDIYAVPVEGCRMMPRRCPPHIGHLSEGYRIPRMRRIVGPTAARIRGLAFGAVPFVVVVALTFPLLAASLVSRSVM
jgi:hypothetical protein